MRGLLPAPRRERTFTRTVTQENRSPKRGRLPWRRAAGSASSSAIPHAETPRCCAFWSLGAGKPQLEGLGPCQVPRHSPALSGGDRLAVWASRQIHKPPLEQWSRVKTPFICASCARLHSSPCLVLTAPGLQTASSLPAALPNLSSTSAPSCLPHVSTGSNDSPA